MKAEERVVAMMVEDEEANDSGYKNTMDVEPPLTKREIYLLIGKYAVISVLFWLFYRAITNCLSATNGNTSCFSPTLSFTTITSALP